METHRFLASCPRGLADLLARELRQFAAEEVRELSTAVTFAAPLAVAYRACLWSRVANRVFLELARFAAPGADQFYAGVREIDWSHHIGWGATLACDFSGRHPTITHTHFGALKLKDAIVDALRETAGGRPTIELEQPSVRVHAHAQGTAVTVSLDLSGESLHRRGYRGAAVEAPLKENVAAGVLLRCGWPELAAAGAAFVDPMCGSGTFPIEAALIAADRAPGLSRTYFGFLGWRGHDARVWAELRAEADARASAPAPALLICGHDRDPGAVRIAKSNAQRAGVEALVQFEVRPLADAAPAASVAAAAAALARAAAGPSAPADLADHEYQENPPREAGAITAAAAATAEPAAVPAVPGLLCVNPPYGIRLEDRDVARVLHREIGAVLRARFQGWNAAVLTGSPELGMELGIRAHRTHTVWNGAIECRLLRLKVEAASEREPGRLARSADNLRDSPGARMFANRLAKNLRQLKKWARNEDVECYRLYDADMPEYAFAIDTYHTLEPEQDWLVVQEYAAPAEIELDAVHRRRAEALATLPQVTGVPAERIRVRIRRRIRRGDQYSKIDEQANFHLVREGGLKFRVNFDDYLDTGLFLDHRLTRQRLFEAAAGKQFLNLYAYTGTATAYAAAGGAASTTTVDLSRTYLDWAQRNLALNAIAGGPHEFVQADCREWLERSAHAAPAYDLIFLDPPTFSNSKRMEGVLDVERDHAALIDLCVRLLRPQGLILFSTNAQKFHLDAALTTRHAIKDISAATLPRDFERNPRIHRCFEIRALQPSATTVRLPK